MVLRAGVLAVAALAMASAPAPANALLLKPGLRGAVKYVGRQMGLRPEASERHWQLAYGQRSTSATPATPEYIDWLSKSLRPDKKFDMKKFDWELERLYRLNRPAQAELTREIDRRQQKFDDYSWEMNSAVEQYTLARDRGDVEIANAYKAKAKLLAANCHECEADASDVTAFLEQEPEELSESARFEAEEAAILAQWQEKARRREEHEELLLKRQNNQDLSTLNLIDKGKDTTETDSYSSGRSDEDEEGLAEVVEEHAVSKVSEKKRVTWDESVLKKHPVLEASKAEPSSTVAEYEDEGLITDDDEDEYLERAEKIVARAKADVDAKLEEANKKVQELIFLKKQNGVFDWLSAQLMRKLISKEFEIQEKANAEKARIDAALSQYRQQQERLLEAFWRGLKREGSAFALIDESEVAALSWPYWGATTQRTSDA